MTEHAYLTVTALTRYIKKKFDADPYLRKVYVKGELSNVKYHSNGHIYFTLKDAGARISCAMFAGQARTLSFRAEEGMNVFVTGDISLFESAGNYQFYVKSMEPDGIGALFVAFEQLKRKLEQEGLFSASLKKPLPKIPLHIGVITSPTGAAIRDILTTLERRLPLARVTVFSTLVQGSGAGASIVESIQKANRVQDLDVLIVGRGGGSIEDLWAFNEEPVARAIANSQVPIISAVGHETDTTIADFVSDLRAPTPTAAAELAVPDRVQLVRVLSDQQTRLRTATSNKLFHAKDRLTRVQRSVVYMDASRLYRPYVEQHLRLHERLESVLRISTERYSNHYSQLTNRLDHLSPDKRVQMEQKALQALIDRLQYVIKQNTTFKKRQFVETLRTLEALSPLQTMKKGFVYTEVEGTVIRSVDQLQKNDELTIHFQDGTAIARIESIEKGETNGTNI